MAQFLNWDDSELKLSQINKKVRKEICHPGDRTKAKKSNDFQKMISVDFGQPLQPYDSHQYYHHISSILENVKGYENLY